MPVQFSRIAPFFEPRAPPPSIPILLAQTELIETSAIETLLCHEEISLPENKTTRFSLSHKPKKPAGTNRDQPSPPPPSRQTLQPRFATPTMFKRATPYPPPNVGARAPSMEAQKKRTPILKVSQTPELSEVESEDSSTESDSSVSSSEDEDEVTPIPKPDGEVGRPGRGGYNLELALGWHPKELMKLKKLIHRLIAEHLDTTKSFSSQTLASIREIRKIAVETFPLLQNYEVCWPVNDIIKLHLKYTSGRARREELKALAGRR